MSECPHTVLRKTPSEMRCVECKTTVYLQWNMLKKDRWIKLPLP